MPAPAAYTETTLAEYMRDTLKNVAVDLGWTDVTPTTGHFRKPVSDVAVKLGVANVAESTAPVELIQLHARVAAWQEAVEAYTTAYYMGGLARSLRRDQLWDHARAMLAQAQLELDEFEHDDAIVSGGPTAIPRSGVVGVRIVW